jgi:hypothetical protein
MCKYVVFGGHLDILKWMKLNNYKIYDDIAIDAEILGSKKIMSWIKIEMQTH